MTGNSPSTPVCNNQDEYDKNEVNGPRLLSYNDDMGKQVTRHLPCVIEQIPNNNKQQSQQPTTKHAFNYNTITPEQTKASTLLRSHNTRRTHERQRKRQKYRRRITTG